MGFVSSHPYFTSAMRCFGLHSTDIEMMQQSSPIALRNDMWFTVTFQVKYLQAINESWSRVSNIYSNFTAAYTDLKVRFENHKKCKRAFREMFCSSLWPRRKETALTWEGGTWEGCRKWIGGWKRKSREEISESKNFHSCYFHISATMRNKLCICLKLRLVPPQENDLTWETGWCRKWIGLEF